ncbi:DUF3078 domain-containing protein [Cellulophaga sp. 20_2_10]|uniref:DUF3078 domain-containing protein n=1 Tax=Cellulophaga sp. 20_2_10 TaxID=2942476 RepID=UPI00201B30FE|nr:DUF3078 domain-containing protein [Cellulophaga sp. 20_2_10]MCL5245581.1 DUF3078 domain-containing protein [Cellulophaga sp. 20_2_10]
MFKRVIVLLVLVFCFKSVNAQVRNPLEVDSVKVDTTIVGTIVVRRNQDKIKQIPRGVKLANPRITYEASPRKEKFDWFKIPSFWDKTNHFGVAINEVAFVNWKAGGNNSVSAIGDVKFVRNYKFRYVQWNNSLDLRFGLSAIEGEKLRKADDAIRFSSTFAYRRDTISNWYYSVKANFNSQFADGYKYPDTENLISKFMAPGYLFLGVGTSYIPEGKKFNLYISPITQKATFVLDDNLANSGAFGVEKAERDADGNITKKGEKSLMELGFLVTNTWKTEIYTNMTLEHEVSLYTDYLNSFGNVDVDWELRLGMKVNEYVKATIGTNLLYDDDILFDEVVTDGVVTTRGRPKIQFKQLLGVGLSYDF